MAEGVLEGLVLVLTVLGALALLSRLLRRLFRLALRAAEVTAARGMAEVSARRGDLTTLAERRADEERARRLRRTDLALVALWLLWLVVPLVAGWAAEAYALAAPLWLLPRK